MKDSKKTKELKLKKRRNIALFLITVLIIILLGIAAITTYTILTKKKVNEPIAQNIGNNIAEKYKNNKCIEINPLIDGNKYTIFNIGTTCATLKIGNEYNLRYEVNDDGYQLYLNDASIKTDIFLNSISYYLTDYGIITEIAKTTCGNSNYMLIHRDGTIDNLLFRDGMCPKSDSINFNNNIISIDVTSNCGCNVEQDVSGNSYNPFWFVSNENYITLSSKLNQPANSQLSFDELINKYNITPDFILEAKYIYNLSVDNFDMKVESIKNIKQFYDEYNNNYIFN